MRVAGAAGGAGCAQVLGVEAILWARDWQAAVVFICIREMKKLLIFLVYLTCVPRSWFLHRSIAIALVTRQSDTCAGVLLTPLRHALLLKLQQEGVFEKALRFMLAVPS